MQHTLPRNLGHLRLLMTVARTGSLSKAADIAGLSQPAVSQAIARIESAVGAPLLTRGAKGVAPNARAEILLTRLDRAFAILDPVLTDISPRMRHAPMRNYKR